MIKNLSPVRQAAAPIPANNFSNAATAPRCVCQVDNCKRQLSSCSEEQKCLLICDSHYGAAEVTHGGTLQRFCQQCGHMQPLEEFEAGQHACRSRCQLAARRRKRGRKEGEDFAVDEGEAAVAAASTQDAPGGVPPKPLRKVASAGGANPLYAASAQQQRNRDRVTRRLTDDTGETTSSSMCSGGGGPTTAGGACALSAPVPVPVMQHRYVAATGAPPSAFLLLRRALAAAVEVQVWMAVRTPVPARKPCALAPAVALAFA
ncbi:hypothetical protein GPECTOR_86g377 [Gonium pectorale]|uniref:SBP-type domain-containing protein n=1 Tax=Gonium pectorale TaxID=33097 RepID=A0A150G179_GONPE|nr:hypothetical protein GPECTOR_86g377 [Gonium pectorale]|eukprot:KXZ43584.1 hypothetical protein GPECTOR_86g377 [Gonium pectorale]